MNWDAVAAISAAFGAIGVIATVGYLAVQIRQNTSSVQGATEQSLMTAEMALYGLLAEHASVYRRGCEGATVLDPDEEAQFEQLVMAVMSQLYGAYVQHKRKIIPDSVWTAYLNDWTNYVELAGFQRMWRKNQNSYPHDFGQCLKKLGESLNVEANA